MKILLGMALLLTAVATFSAAVATAQDSGTPGPPATPGVIDGADSSGVVEETDRPLFWRWVGWPTWFGSMMLGIFWAYRRAHTSLVKAFVDKLIPGSQEQPLDRSPFVQTESSSVGLVSGALLLALTTLFFLSQFAIYEYPSDLKFPTEAFDILPWLDFAPWLSTLFAPLMVGLLSESRGVWMIPVLGYLLGMALWLTAPGEDLGDLTYDLGELGFLIMRVAVPALLMYLAYRFGRAFRRPFA